MLLSDRRIKEELIKGSIVISPFRESQLGANSYDVRLGEYYWIPNPIPKTVNFFDEKMSKDFWLGPRQASSPNLVLHRDQYDPDKQYIVIRPQQTILAHTEEFIGGFRGVTASMRCRSGLARACLSVCKCAGVGDVGYVSRWTMEITNHSHASIVLPVGARVAQILFYEVGETDKTYAGKYSAGKWSPELMLPKLYQDRE